MWRLKVSEAGLIMVWVPLCSQFCLCSSNFGPLASPELVCLPHTNICSLFVCLLIPICLKCFWCNSFQVFKQINWHWLVKFPPLFPSLFPRWSPWLIFSGREALSFVLLSFCLFVVYHRFQNDHNGWFCLADKIGRLGGGAFFHLCHCANLYQACQHISNFSQVFVQIEKNVFFQNTNRFLPFMNYR